MNFCYFLRLALSGVLRGEIGGIVYLLEVDDFFVSIVVQKHRKIYFMESQIKGLVAFPARAHSQF